MLIPAATSRAVLEVERDAAVLWATRHGWRLQVDLLRLRVRAATRHPADLHPVVLVGRFDDYRALPPRWEFTCGGWTATTANAWPRGGNVLGQGTIFHSVGVICAHFSRAAYQEHGGPHGSDWGPSSRWLEIDQGVQARTLADMLAVIDLHLSVSDGRFSQ